ncbi:MAG: pyruvate kinase [Clostridiales bacterium]|jgi:pyruvate kinase|nr:pyruvate kinase [Clostridiales bacterium]
MRKTKIVATLGPASDDVEIIKELIRSGMNAARINFSHGTEETRTEIINKLKEARTELNQHIPLILDTKGPEIRIKTFEEDKIYIAQGNLFTLTTEDIVGDKTRVAVTYSELPKDLNVGSRVLIDDGLIELKVKDIVDSEIHCVAVNSGFLSSRKGVNVPDVYVNLPSLTENDVVDICFGIRMEFDYIAASFIRSANDILNIRQVLEENGGGNIQIIAKIESRDGVTNLDSILEVADGIMVARGDLGVEIPPEEVPLVQKELIHKANQIGKPVITATQMLESMVQNPRPTRAEANDVANAIFDGSDAIMLSGETAYGKYPVESVAMMARIAVKSEESIDYYSEITNHYPSFKSNITNSISYAACTAAADLNAVCIVSVTDSGFTARMVSKFRPTCSNLAITAEPGACRQLNLLWGCVPMLVENLAGNDEVFNIVEQKAVESGLAKNGDAIVAVAGVPVGVAGTTNTLKVRIVGDVLIQGAGWGDKVVHGSSRVIKVIEEAERFFKKGDVLVTTKTNDDMMPYIRKAGAIIAGTWENVDNGHAVTVAKALEIPLIIAKQRVVDLIPDGVAITVDSKNGFVYNGYKD